MAVGTIDPPIILKPEAAAALARPQNSDSSDEADKPAASTGNSDQASTSTEQQRGRQMGDIAQVAQQQARTPDQERQEQIAALLKQTVARYPSLNPEEMANVKLAYAMPGAALGEGLMKDQVQKIAPKAYEFGEDLAKLRSMNIMHVDNEHGARLPSQNMGVQQVQLGAMRIT
jgi:hypothetical protein